MSARPAVPTVAVHLMRGFRAEAVRTGGWSFLWRVAVPIAVVLPMAVTFGIAYVAESFARIPGQLGITAVGTGNSVYWVMSVTVVVMMVTAAYAHAQAQRSAAGVIQASVLPREWLTALARWCYFGALSAGLTFVLMVVVMIALPAWFPLVYGQVDIASAVGERLLWAVPVYAFLACGVGVAAGMVLRSPAVAVAVLLFWVLLVENAIALVPHGFQLQAFMPFLNGVYATGQEISFVPHWGRGGALVYFAVLAVVVFAFAVSATALRRGLSRVRGWSSRLRTGGETGRN